MRFIDTNIFLRFMLEDEPEKQAACAELFRRIAEGEEVATTSETVLAEVIYVTTSPRTYRVPARAACIALRS